MRLLAWPPPRDPRAWDNLVLLLTASIRPNSRLIEETVGDARSREADYAHCLTHYLETIPRLWRVVFVDNSGWDLSVLRAAAERSARPSTEVELLSVDGNDFPGDLGKGWGEGELLRRALDQSRLLKAAPRFAKMTGRHLLFNLAEIVERTAAGYDMVCDLRDHGIYEALRLPATGRRFDSRFFICSRQFYERHYRDVHLHFRQPGVQGYYIESGFYATTKALEGHEHILCRFPIEPVYGGVAGHGKDYDSFGERLKRAVRGSTRIVAPWLRV